MQSVNTAFRNVSFFDAPIGLRVFYAVVAALLWWGMAELDQAVGDDSDLGLLFYATGGVFSALVLVPYLPSIKGTFTLRAVGLLLVGVFSYWSAIKITGELVSNPFGYPSAVNWVLLPRDVWSDWPDRYLVAIAGVYGAAIIGVGARLLVPLTLRWSGWLMVLAAGCLGGAVIGIGEEMHTHGGDASLYWLPGHIAWEVLVCLALYYGSERATNLIP